MIGHEGGHRSFSATPGCNELLLHVAFPLIGGLSASYWKDKHNAKHHGQPNIDGVDDDLEIWPMAGSRRQHEASSRLLRWLQRHHQGWLFWPLSSFLSHSMRYSSISFLVRRARAGRLDRAFWIDAACLALHYAAWLVVPSLAFGLWTTLGFYALLWGIVSVYLTAIFASAHLGLPIYRSHPEPWRLQLEATRNLRVPPWIRFFLIGLDHQVEHHLFTRMPHQNLPVAAPLVRAWAEERGLPYQEVGFFRGLVEVTRFARNAWRFDAVPAPVVSGQKP
jgi:fatty acid desaturase